MDISKLKSRRTDITALVEAAKESAGGSKFEKEDTSHIWKPTVDKAGNGYAVIRFLPAEGDVPWVRYWDHGFKGDTGKWYIEKSLTSLGQADPLGEYNAKLWNSGNEDDRATVRKQKRRLHYVVNIQVVSDPSAPHNEGKVFLYQFGKKIFDKIQDLMQPQFPGETPCDPFDLWAGADFQLKIRQLDGYRNYDKSEFKASTALAEGDEVQLQAIMNQIYDINYYSDPANYKTYDELQTKLFEVLGETAPRTVKEEVALDTVSEPVAPKTVAPATADATDDAGDDDAMSYFQKLANAD
jgi:hypothetical protein